MDRPVATRLGIVFLVLVIMQPDCVRGIAGFSPAAQIYCSNTTSWYLFSPEKVQVVNMESICQGMNGSVIDTASLSVPCLINLLDQLPSEIKNEPFICIRYFGPFLSQAGLCSIAGSVIGISNTDDTKYHHLVCETQKKYIEFSPSSTALSVSTPPISRNNSHHTTPGDGTREMHASSSWSVPANDSFSTAYTNTSHQTDYESPTRKYATVFPTDQKTDSATTYIGSTAPYINTAQRTKLIIAVSICTLAMLLATVAVLFTRLNHIKRTPATSGTLLMDVLTGEQTVEHNWDHVAPRYDVSLQTDISPYSTADLIADEGHANGSNKMMQTEDTSYELPINVGSSSGTIDNMNGIYEDPLPPTDCQRAIYADPLPPTDSPMEDLKTSTPDLDEQYSTLGSQRLTSSNYDVLKRDPLTKKPIINMKRISLGTEDDFSTSAMETEYDNVIKVPILTTSGDATQEADANLYDNIGKADCKQIPGAMQTSSNRSAHDNAVVLISDDIEFSISA
eukprot:scpid53498/ scgid5868/ 